MYHPHVIMTLLFTNLAQKVYRPKAPTSYLWLSGSLAFVLPILLTLLILATLGYLSFYPQWLGGLVLFLCLDIQHERRAKRIAILLKQQQKAAARQLVSVMVNRDVEKLSAMGICKACLDSLALRGIRHFYLVIVFYLIGGPLLALGYKLMLLCDHAWRSKMRPDASFIRPLQLTLAILEWLPVRGLVIVMALTQNLGKTLHYLKHYGQFYQPASSGWILTLFAASLNTQLAGPRFYQQQRFDNMRIGSDTPPESETISLMLRLLATMRWFFLCALCLCWLTVNVLTH
ncbi:cobalamin biosynthesis protein [Pseudoalteromonas sp. OOF1S-7]|uniref:cobalamin biosynthesis protein n=1 Tax=Pseudoalteromonas sp. OOF1S-7 TaxID=2917757 RepID=UPI001EF52A17|nr:cobalamin biosynthesis protein [Pseudoalteromonas sp. OOF1S-7]MCG7536310.1 cobalamin biosynthesis protein [Pseudoalteromonas sp. OOF1S-7]